MADAATTQILFDGDRRATVKLASVSDGTGESAVLKVDASALSGAPAKLTIERIQYSVAGMSVSLLWDATTDVPIVHLHGEGCIDAKKTGGLVNDAGTGRTGDILLTTVGAASGATYTIVLDLIKSW